MAQIYDITFDGAIVGTAKMERQGLYHAFSCRCRLPDQGLYRIHVLCGEKYEDLGICVPMGDSFGMDKKLAAKKLGEGTPAFELRPKDWIPQPVAEEQKAAPEEAASEETAPQEQYMPEEEMQQEEPVLPEPEEENFLQTVDTERFIPVSGEEPFDHLDKLENARMEIRDGISGILIPAEEETEMDG